MLKDPEEVSKVTIKTSKCRLDPVAPILQSEAQKYIVNYFKASKILHDVHHDFLTYFIKELFTFKRSHHFMVQAQMKSIITARSFLH